MDPATIVIAFVIKINTPEVLKDDVSNVALAHIWPVVAPHDTLLARSALPRYPRRVLASGRWLSQSDQSPSYCNPKRRERPAKS